jgi:OPA family sugar phosphate sensor protein UhpC-like MFS transporter
VLLFAYAIGKFVNGFLADHCNIKRFMATGLIISAAANLMMGILGFSSGVLPAATVFLLFAVMWGINGWSQSMGAPPAIIALSRWYPLSKRGTFYGFFSLSHNLGEWLSFLFVGILVSVAGWQWGFFGSAIAGAVGVIVIVFLLHDNPQSKGLPSVEDMSGEVKAAEVEKESTGSLQKMVLKTPAVWILAAASAFMYIARYAINGWGVLFLQEEKGFSLTEATTIISINALLGIFGTVLSGWVSDKLFRSDRYIPALIFGAMNSVALVLFLFGGNSWAVNIIAMVLFGISIGVLICFLGGLMAVDIVPRKATGAALGVVGAASYVAAGIQDVASGWLIDGNTTLVDRLDEATGQFVQATQYDFTPVAIFWIVASIISFMLPILNWKYRKNA